MCIQEYHVCTICNHWESLPRTQCESKCKSATPKVIGYVCGGHTKVKLEPQLVVVVTQEEAGQAMAETAGASARKEKMKKTMSEETIKADGYKKRASIVKVP